MFFKGEYCSGVNIFRDEYFLRGEYFLVFFSQFFLEYLLKDKKKECSSCRLREWLLCDCVTLLSLAAPLGQVPVTAAFSKKKTLMFDFISTHKIISLFEISSHGMGDKNS